MLICQKLFPSFLMALLTILSLASAGEAIECHGQEVNDCTKIDECGEYYVFSHTSNHYVQCDYDPDFGTVSDDYCSWGQVCTLKDHKGG